MVNRRTRCGWMVLFLVSALSACVVGPDGQYLGHLSFPFGIRKEKKKLRPPLPFVEAMFAYQKKQGFWPHSEVDFVSANNEPVVEDLHRNGFTSWRLGYHSLDTLVVHYVHAPVYTQQIYLVAIRGRPVKLKTIFIASTYSHHTSLE